jgi:large repetitive protein
MATGLISGIGGGTSCGSSRSPKHSFDSHTKVLMADGSKRPIQDVNVGDEVVATDPETGKSYKQPVTQLHRNTDHEFSDVTVKDQDGKTTVLDTTQNHPFWNDTTKEWTEAKDLKPGDHLKVAGHGDVVVNDVRNYDGTKEMRDLTVADTHTYYVFTGDEFVLVHNCGGSEPGHIDNCRCADGGPRQGPGGRILPGPTSSSGGSGPEVRADGWLRGTNESGYTSSRGGWRTSDEDAAWTSGTAGPTGGVMCPRGGPNCRGEVHRNPTEEQYAGDMGHYPTSHTNRFYPPDDRTRALEIYREDIRIECIPCNRGDGNRNDGVS